MTPEEFAELNGAYPDAPNNPTPSTTGFMDNGGFAWAGKNAEEGQGKTYFITDMRWEVDDDPSNPRMGYVDHLYHWEATTEKEIFGMIAEIVEATRPFRGNFVTDITYEIKPYGYEDADYEQWKKENPNWEEDNLEYNAEDNYKLGNYAESFESEWVIEAVQQNLNDKDFVDYAYSKIVGGNAKGHGAKSMAIAETMSQNSNNKDFTTFVETEVFNAEIEDVTDSMAVITNKFDDMVGVVEVDDDDDDDELVEVSIQDENMNEVGSYTLDDGVLDEHIYSMMAEGDNRGAALAGRSKKVF